MRQIEEHGLKWLIGDEQTDDGLAHLICEPR